MQPTQRTLLYFHEIVMSLGNTYTLGGRIAEEIEQISE